MRNLKQLCCVAAAAVAVGTLGLSGCDEQEPTPSPPTGAYATQPSNQPGAKVDADPVDAAPADKADDDDAAK